MNILVLAAALAAQEGPEPPRPDLNWLAGYWLSCEAGREVSETWSDVRGGLVLGTGIASDPAGGASWEQMRIGPSTDGVLDGLSFYAQPGGQGAAEFPLVRWSESEAVFENPAHDFPQRVIYRRDGERLVGRIEGMADGAPRSAEWRYDPAPLNARCGEVGI